MSTIVSGQFRTFSEWVNKARSWIGGTGAVCTDSKGRVCGIGKDFMRARDEGAFPVTYTFDADVALRRPLTKRQRAQILMNNPEAAARVAREEGE